jgi:hypothetical protein
MLGVGTTQGLALLSGGQIVARALPGSLITHLAITPTTVYAAVPTPGPVHRMLPMPPPGEATPATPGLWACDLPSTLASTSEGHLSCRQVWAGNARSVAAHPSLLAAGVEPADVYLSGDGGATWDAGAAGFSAAPSRGNWSFPAPPHEPHVLSIEILEKNSSELEVLAGIEVGGAMLGTFSGPLGTSAETAAPAAKRWEERNSGLYTDVHSCRVAPHDPSTWWAVTGGGLYNSNDAGGSWRRIALGAAAPRYPVGLALNPERQGEVLITAGDRPPAIGCHVLHSLDGGETWSDATAAAVAALGPDAPPPRMTPVPFFLGEKAALGTDSGAILVAEGDGSEGRWAVAAQVGAPITCMATPGLSPSSVMH